MNKLTIIGNLARDPELRTVRDGISVCDFTVAVNRRQPSEHRKRSVGRGFLSCNGMASVG